MAQKNSWEEKHCLAVKNKTKQNIRTVNFLKQRLLGCFQAVLRNLRALLRLLSQFCLRVKSRVKDVVLLLSWGEQNHKATLAVLGRLLRNIRHVDPTKVLGTQSMRPNLYTTYHAFLIQGSFEGRGIYIVAQGYLLILHSGMIPGTAWMTIWDTENQSLLAICKTRTQALTPTWQEILFFF